MGPLGGLEGSQELFWCPEHRVSLSVIRVSQEGGGERVLLQLEAPGTLTPFLPPK